MIMTVSLTAALEKRKTASVKPAAMRQMILTVYRFVTVLITSVELDAVTQMI